MDAIVTRRLWGAQWRGELLKLFARKRTHIGFAAFLALQVAFLLLLQLPKSRAAFARLLERNGYGLEEYFGGLTLAVMIVHFTMFLLGGLYLALVGGDIVAKEVEEGTLRMMLSRPVSRLRVAALKWTAAATYTLALALFVGASSLAIATLRLGRLGRLFVFAPELNIFEVFGPLEGLGRYAAATTAMGFASLVVTSLAFCLSCLRMKPAAATILCLSFLFADMVLRNIPYFAAYQEWFITWHTSVGLRLFQQPIPWWSVGASFAYLAALNATFFTIGAAALCARDFK